MFAQAITNLSEEPLATTAVLNPLTPGSSVSPARTSVQFRIQGKDKDGYRVDAVVLFSRGAAASVDGGATIAASDIGIGVTSISWNGQASSSRLQDIQPGFNYDPGAITTSNGLSPYTGASLGRATLADLTGGRKILSGPRIGPGNSGKGELDVTLTFGVMPQYFTPSNFLGTVTLTVTNGL